MCGVCGTDQLNRFLRSPSSSPSNAAQCSLLSLTYRHIHEGEFISKFPLIPGHELSQAKTLSLIEFLRKKKDVLVFLSNIFPSHPLLNQSHRDHRASRLPGTQC
jgi:hypothetical protein